VCVWQAIFQYRNSKGFAEVVWCQEEPKNQVISQNSGHLLSFGAINIRIFRAFVTHSLAPASGSTCGHSLRFLAFTQFPRDSEPSSSIHHLPQPWRQFAGVVSTGGLALH
jgi:hypothetical protein